MRPAIAKLIDRSVLLTATLILMARQYGYPSTRFWIWNGHEYLVAALLATIASFGALTPFQAWVERAQVAHRTAVRQQVLTHFGRLLSIAARTDPPVPGSDLGLHVWRVRWFWRSRPGRRLTRLATYRLGTTPATRAFEPVRGVGVVGLCWKRNEEVAVDVEALARQLTTKEQYSAFEAGHGPDAVMGLSWPDFVRVRHRGAVFASPIRNRLGDFIGCVSVDTSWGFEVLSVGELWHEINSLCLMLGHDGLRNV